MPELPEVETVLRTLENQIKDCKISNVEVIYKKIIECSPNKFINSLKGQHFRNFKRRGKYLIFEMDTITLVSHLRMEGKYYILDRSVPRDKHTHIVFTLDNRKELRYHDVRKFGRMYLIDKQDNYNDFFNLGPEPFDKTFCLNYCKEYFRNKKLPVKQILLRQEFVAGIGNIYANEILFASCINPLKKVNCLKDDEIECLIRNTKKILKEAIKKGGTTIRSYTSSLGVTGRFQNKLNVHTQSKCKICGSDIKKIYVSGRGTYYCPICQK